jgi:hypothetical protein
LGIRSDRRGASQSRPSRLRPDGGQHPSAVRHPTGVQAKPGYYLEGFHRLPPGRPSSHRLFHSRGAHLARSRYLLRALLHASGSRRVNLAGLTRHPTTEWMLQMAPNASDENSGFLRGDHTPHRRAGCCRLEFQKCGAELRIAVMLKKVPRFPATATSASDCIRRFGNKCLPVLRQGQRNFFQLVRSQARVVGLDRTNPLTRQNLASMIRMKTLNKTRHRHGDHGQGASGGQLTPLWARGVLCRTMARRFKPGDTAFRGRLLEYISRSGTVHQPDRGNSTRPQPGSHPGSSRHVGKRRFGSQVIGRDESVRILSISNLARGHV